MHESGEVNVGQLVQERYGRETVLIGFTTHSGTVAAASHWDGPMERKVVRPALTESYEALFHQLGVSQFILTWEKSARRPGPFKSGRLERAIGVIYLPQTERTSHYFYVLAGAIRCGPSHRPHHRCRTIGYFQRL